MPRVKKLNMKMSRAREYLGCSAERSAVHIRLMVSRESARLRVTVCLTVRWVKGLGNEAGMSLRLRRWNVTVLVVTPRALSQRS